MIHLVKLCVGIGSVDELEALRPVRSANGEAYGDDVHVHRTRMMPRRAEQIAGQGSLYWVIGGAIRCRQKIVRLTSGTDHEGRSCCDIVLAAPIIRTVRQPRRPFQGWRYLAAADAPRDLDPATGAGGEGELVEELARLGLL